MADVEVSTAAASTLENSPKDASSASAPALSDKEDELSPELKALMKKYPNLKTTENGKRIKCVFTGHEMAVTLKAVQQYVDGKKYAKYMKNPTFDISQWEPHLTPVVTPGSGKKGGKGRAAGEAGAGKNTDNHKQLYCQLTHRLINRDPIHILKHVQGYRFVREKLRYDECARKGVPYEGIVRSKQKMFDLDEDQEDVDDDFDEAIGKDSKKFSTNPEISDSEEENDDDADVAKGNDLDDLYPPEDFKSEEDEKKGEKDDEEINGDLRKDDDDDASDTSTDEDVGSDSTDSEEEEANPPKLAPGFQGFPFKLQTKPPPKRKKSNKTDGGGFKKKFKKKRVA